MSTIKIAPRAAFPRDTKWATDGSIIQEGSTGMSLRDYFAGQALVGLASSYADAPGSFEELIYGAANTAYHMADAMLKEREK